MKESDRTKKLAQLLRATGVLDFGEFTLTSGKTSPYYVDLRLLPSHPIEFDLAGDLMAQTIKEKEISFDSICAVPTGGLPLGALVANKLESPLIYVRKKAKGHGEGRQIEGAFQAGDQVLVLDDLITTGGSILEAIEELRGGGASVQDALVLLDRQEEGRKNLGEAGVTLHAAGEIGPLVEELAGKGEISPDLKEKVFRHLQRSAER